MTGEQVSGQDQPVPDEDSSVAQDADPDLEEAEDLTEDGSLITGTPAPSPYEDPTADHSHQDDAP